MSGSALTPMSESAAECTDFSTSDESRPLRRDAERNRARILDAARELFATRGLDVGVDEIARRAGVGMGTLYRRFPNKDALVDAILRTVVERSRAVAEEALATQPPADALRWFVVNTVEAGAVQRVFLSNRMWTGRMHELLYEQVVPLMSTLFENAKTAGVIRADAAFTDLLLLIRAMRGVMDETEGPAPGAWHRQLAILFDGLRPCSSRPPLEPGPVDLEMIRRTPRRGGSG